MQTTTIISGQYSQTPTIIPGTQILLDQIQRGLTASSPNSIRCATRERTGSPPVSPVHCWPTYYGWQHYCNICWWHCRLNWARKSSNSLAQTAIMAKKWRMKANKTKSVQVTFTLTENATGATTYLQSENNQTSNSVICIGSLVANHSYHWPTSSLSTKPSWNPYEHMVCNYGELHPTLI